MAWREQPLSRFPGMGEAEPGLLHFGTVQAPQCLVAYLAPILPTLCLCFSCSESCVVP